MKKYYHMAACEVEVQVKDAVFSQKVNVLHTTIENRVNPTDLGLFQQKASLAYVNQLKERGLDTADVQINDVIILGISKLGQFTEAEWTNTTPATVKREQRKSHLSVVETPEKADGQG